MSEKCSFLFKRVLSVSDFLHLGTWFSYNLRELGSFFETILRTPGCSARTLDTPNLPNVIPVQHQLLRCASLKELDECL
jgi:hypothetical protein